MIREIYSKRSETIERVFADAKELHGLRYTQYRGLAKLKMELTLKFACMNLKKLAIWKARNSFSALKILDFLKNFIILHKKREVRKILTSLCLQAETTTSSGGLLLP